MVLNDTTKTLITISLLSLLLMPGLGLTVTAKLKDTSGMTNDTNAVHKWELWDSDLNITGSGRFPFLKAGNMEIPYELSLAGFENLITGIFALTNSTENKYGFTSMVTSDDPGNPIPAGLFLDYGTHSGNGGASVFSVWRFCNLTGSGFCNTGPLADFGDFSNTMFPSAALSIGSDAPDSPQILRLNGYFLDSGSKMIYLANTANTMAITAENGDLVCNNLNADMVDSLHSTDLITISGDQYITGSLGVSDNMTAAYFIGDGSLLTNIPKPDNATYADDSDKLDGHHWSDVVNTKVNNATYSDLANNSYNLGNKPASAYLTSNGMASESSYLYVNGSRNMTGTLIVPSLLFNSPATMGLYGDSAYYSFGTKNLAYADSDSPYNQVIMRVDTPDISVWSGGSKYISLSRTGGGYSSILSNDDIHIDATAGNQDIYMDGNSLIAQSVYDETSGGSANVYVDTDGHLYRSTSSARYKTNIADLSIDTSRIYNLRLREYDYNTTNNQLKNKATHSIGLVAEEAVLIMPEVVVYGNNTLDGIDYPRLTISMLSEMKKLKNENIDLKNRLYTLCVNNGLKGCS